MAKKKYLELRDVRAHYDTAKEQVILTSASPLMRKSGFKVALEKNTRTELSVKNRLRKAGMLGEDQPTLKVDWNDDNVLTIAGKAGIGKTAFASILASALSDIGKKVLLIDTVAGDERFFRYAPHKADRPSEFLPGYRFIETAHGWDVLLAPQDDQEKASAEKCPADIHGYIQRLKTIYDVLIFDTSEDFLSGCEYSPFLRYFSNILLLTHPYRQGNELAQELISRLPKEIALNSLITGPKWQDSPYRESSKLFGSWEHMQDFYRLDNDALLSRGTPLAHMHGAILPYLPLAFRP